MEHWHPPLDATAMAGEDRAVAVCAAVLALGGTPPWELLGPLEADDPAALVAVQRVVELARDQRVEDAREHLDQLLFGETLLLDAVVAVIASRVPLLRLPA